MASIGDLVKRTSHYSLANGAIMAASFVSFPIFTRVLSVAEYGVMGLMSMLRTFLTGLSKLGLQHSSLRFYAEWEHKERGVETFIFTFFVAAALGAVAVTGISAGIAVSISSWIGERLTFFFLLACPLFITDTMSSFGLNLLRARQDSGPRAIFEVISTYLAMGLAVLCTISLIGGLKGYYIGLTAGEAAVTVTLVFYVLRWTRLKRTNWQPSLFREAIAFGLPMTITEICTVLFHMADRVIIQWLMNEVHVGYYTVAYQIANYASILFSVPMEMAVVPMYTKLYEEEGQEATSEFLKRSARLFLMMSLPAVVGLGFIRDDLVAVLASRQFLPGAHLVHYLLAGFLLFSTRAILGAGMFLKKRPWLMAGLGLAGSIVNIALNLVFIPPFGITGAVIATVVSQFVMALVFWYIGSRLVRVGLDLPALALHIVCVGTMGAALFFLDVGEGVLRLLLRVVAGAVIYAVLIALLDSEARAFSRTLLNRLRHRE
jgi:O-antigen/teichoic acid export membrane protein